MGMKWIAIALCMLVTINTFAETKNPKRKATPPPSRQEIVQPESKVWSREPRSFMGVALGEPFTAPECPMKDTPYPDSIDFDAIRQAGVTCFDNSMRKYRSTTGVDPQGQIQILGPALGIGYTAHAWLEQGRVMSISLTFDSQNFQEMADLFTQRFGEPTTNESSNVQSMAGAIYPQTELTWVGEKTSIVIERRGARVDSGFADIQDNELTQLVQQRRQNVQKERADKL